MGRPIRQFVAGYPVHVIHRGNGRRDVFLCDADFRVMSRWLKETADEFEVAVNAYVLMTNHFHFLLTPTADCASLSRMIQVLARKYSVHFNTRYARTGTLWEGRFRGSLVTSDYYFLACHRYIDLNPVRAGMVTLPQEYPWSSHRCYADSEPSPLVTPHHAITTLGEDDGTRRLKYRALFE